MKKLVSLLLTGALACGLLAGCGGNAASTPAPADTTAPVDTTAPAETNPLDGTVLKVGATPAPHAEILEVVKDLLAQQGITLEIVEFNDYIQPNLAVEDGSLDANYFQHITYMNEFNESDGTHLVSAAEIHYEPFGLYAGKTSSISDLADGAQIAVPNDTTNEARALLLLEQEGLITLKEGAGITATKADIAENPKNLDIVELEASQLPVRLADVDMAVINGNYAIDAGLNPKKDALVLEKGGKDSEYPNQLVVRKDDKDNEHLKKLAKLLNDDKLREYINKTWPDGAVVAAF